MGRAPAKPSRHRLSAPRPRWRTLPPFLVRLNKVQLGGLIVALGLCLAGAFLAFGRNAALDSISPANCTNAKIVEVRRNPSKLLPGHLDIEYSVDGRPIRTGAWGDYPTGRQSWTPGDQLAICFTTKPQGFATADGFTVSSSLLPYYMWTLPATLGGLGLVAVLGTVIVNWRDSEEYRAFNEARRSESRDGADDRGQAE